MKTHDTPLTRLKRYISSGAGLLDNEMTQALEEQPLEYPLPDLGSYEEEKQKEHELYDRMHLHMLSKGSKRVRRLYVALASLFACILIGGLLYTVSCMPTTGDPEGIITGTVAQRYINDGLEETGAVNIVAGMILDYRAFDTLGESNVLFLAACSVFLILRAKAHDGEEPMDKYDRSYEPHQDLILQRMADVLTPVILLFGLYIVFNGHLSPGGGFSGGAVMGAGLILYLNAHGYDASARFRIFSYKAYKWTTFAALMFYCLSKMYSFFTGANELESIISNGTPGSIFSAGLILPLNICVGLVVAFTMYGFYTLFRKGDF